MERYGCGLGGKGLSSCELTDISSIVKGPSAHELRGPKLVS